jgi:hypothetical protein
MASSLFILLLIVESDRKHHAVFDRPNIEELQFQAKLVQG